MKWYVLKAQHGTAMADHVVELLCRLVIAELDTSLETSPVVGRGGIPVIQLYSTSTLAFLKLQTVPLIRRTFVREGVNYEVEKWEEL